MYLQYCVDKLLVGHNYSHIYEGDVVNFAYVCLDLEQSVAELVETVVYPAGVALSMASLTLTALLYSLLPQLRDLTGKFILGMCAFLICNYALRLVDLELLGVQDPNLSVLALQLVQHAASVGAWLCLNRQHSNICGESDSSNQTPLCAGATLQN